jgi:hypothetical protein
MANDLDYYAGKLTSEYRGPPNLLAMLTNYVQGFVDQQVQILALPALYDLDGAIGEQLDRVGMWIGANRVLGDVPWTGGTLTTLDDHYYRILLRAKILSNQWDGTTPGAYDFWNKLFVGMGLTVKILDNNDMTMAVTLFGSTDAIINALFLEGLLFVKPSGVAVTHLLG